MIARWFISTLSLPVIPLGHDGVVFRAFQAVLQPTVRQADALQALLAGQRELYNAALEERIGAWR